MNIILETRILDYNVQYHYPNAWVVIIMLELRSQRLAQRISYENFWVIRFIIRDQKSRP